MRLLVLLGTVLAFGQDHHAMVNIKDTGSRDQIRSHFRHIAQMFANGNFNALMLVHSTNVPGTAEMTKLKDQLHWDLQETPPGARLVVTADNKPALDALHTSDSRSRNRRLTNGSLGE